MAGELIKEFSKSHTSLDAGKTQEIKWDTSNISSGVYIWRLKAKDGTKESEIIKKLAIVK